ncbi:MAG: hypothetical protein ACKVOJ_06535 [Sphingomonadaceae bacterium]
MSMRIFSLIPLLILAACGGAEHKGQTLAEIEKQSAGRAADDQGRANCAVGGATSFTQSCSIERAASDKGLVLTLRHDDGGFRRLLVTKDGRGVVAADGAEQAIVKPLTEGLIEVSLGGDRYQLPATVKGAAAPLR